MKTLGIVGGLGPESTIEYYRLIITAYREKAGCYPSILLNSIDVNRVLQLVDAKDLGALRTYLVAALQRLAKAGATLGILAASTPHIVFDTVRKDSPIPLISIVEAACDATKALGLTRLALFGTRFTMQADFYPSVFSRAGIQLLAPPARDQDFIHEKYTKELLNNVFEPETRDGLLAVVDRMQAGQKIEGVILAGTELPLILRESYWQGVVFLNTTQIHALAAVNAMLD